MRWLIMGMWVAIIIYFSIAANRAFAVPDTACNPQCVERVKAKKRAEIRKRHRAAMHRVADPYWGTFVAIASCESHGNWHINTGNGYYGGIQFSLRAWSAVGGRGLPSDASKLEQIYRGVLLMRQQGFGAWPVCRHAAGV